MAVQLLQDIYLFKDLLPKELDQLSELGTVKSYQSEDEVLAVTWVATARSSNQSFDAENPNDSSRVVMLGQDDVRAWASRCSTKTARAASSMRLVRVAKRANPIDLTSIALAARMATPRKFTDCPFRAIWPCTSCYILSTD